MHFNAKELTLDFEMFDMHFEYELCILLTFH